jgi:cell division transport system permease protein
MASNTLPGVGSFWKTKQNFPAISSLQMLLHHIVQTWRSFLTAPLTSILTTITIATALLVFCIFILLVENVRSVVASAGKDVLVSIYFSDDFSQAKIDKFKEELNSFDVVDKVVLKSKTEALEDFKKSLGEQSGILEGVASSNPLPASFEVSFKRLEGIENKINILVKQFSQHEGVEHVSYNRAFIDKLSGFLKFLRFGGVLGIVFMLVITSFIITNTIRLALYSHREEIEIMKLVGATDSFVRAPYLVEGFIQGLLGALVAIFISYACFLVIHDALATNEMLAIILPNFVFLSPSSLLLVVVAGIFVGIGGSYLAVRKFLSV